MDDLIGEFINETSESLATLERALAGHTRQPMTGEGWDMACQLMHTIKGTCGFLRFSNMEKVAASSESLLAGLRDGDITPTDGELAQLRAAMAQIRYMMDHLAEHGTEPSQEQIAQEATPPRPAPYAQLDEQVHRVPEEKFAMPSLPPAPQAIAPVPEPIAGGERVSYATLATLVLARNQLKHLGHHGGDRQVLGSQRLLDQLIADLKEKLLPRTAPATAYPRVGQVLMVESGGQRFALPRGIVREVARIGTTQRHAQLDEGAMISLRGSWLPRISLAQKLGQGSSAGEAYALVIELGRERLALCVESVGELEELMLQPLPRLLRSSKIYEAAAILGDGSPCLILDSAALLALPTRALPLVTPPMVTEDMPVVVAPAAPPRQPVVVATAPSSSTPVMRKPFLLFGDGTPTPKAIPLVQVARVEQLRAADIARERDGLAATCRGETLHLRLLPGSAVPQQGDFHAITLLDAPDVALIAHQMQGITEAAVTFPAAPISTQLLMRAELDGAMTDIINTASYLPPVRELMHG